MRDGIRVFNPRDDGTWYDAAGVKEKFGVRPDQVVDVLALMGDYDRQRERRARASARRVRASSSGPGARSTRCSNTRQKSREEVSRGAAQPPAEARAQPRAAAHSHERAGPVRHRTRSGIADRRSEDCYQLFSDLGFRSLTMEYAPTADTVDEGLPARDGCRTRLERWSAEIRGAGRFALRVLADQPGAIRAGIVGSGAIDARAHGALHPGAALRDAHAVRS